MISVPLKDIITKVSQGTGMSETEIRKKIAEKVEQLYGLVSEEGAAHIIANEHNIKIFTASGDLKLKDVLLGMRAVDVIGKVVRKYELREFSTEKRKGKVANLMIADETGSMRVVFWNDKTDDFNQIKEADIIKIKGASVRDNNGRRELHLGDNAKIIINPENISITTKERKEYDRKHIAELAEGMSAEVLGTIVQVFDIKFFEVCPQCNKRLRMKDTTFFCEEHHEVSPMYNYLLSIYLDDGTGNIRVTCWKQQTQKLLKLPDAEIVLMQKSPELFEKYKTDLLGEQVKILGTAKNNMLNRMEFTAEVIFADLKPNEEIEMLDHAKEVVLQVKSTTTNSNNPSSLKSDDEFEISEDFLE